MSLILLLVSLISIANTQHVEHKNPTIGKTYVYTNLSLSLPRGEAYCKSINASLITIESQQESDWIRNNLNFTRFAFLLGAEITIETVPKRWLDGRAIKWYNWARDEPNFGGSQEWAFIVDRPSGLWFAANSRIVRPIICQRASKREGELQEIRNPQNGKTYLISRVERNLDDGAAYCKSINASLIKVESYEESQWVRANVPVNRFLLPIAISNTSAPTMWLDGSAITWSHWSSQQRPKYAWANRAYWVDNLVGEWAQGYTGQTACTVCERSATNQPLDQQFDEYKNSQNNKTYLVSKMQMNLTRGAAFCKQRNASVIKIESQQEADWIFQNVRRVQFLLGAEITNKTAPKKWLDGSDIKWYSWGLGQPFASSQESWAFLVDNRSGTWWATNSDFHSWIMCERSPHKRDDGDGDILRSVLRKLEQLEQQQSTILEWLRRINAKLDRKQQEVGKLRAER